jgi:DNA invertase Pin-like site-specific DNA recombinase
MKTVGYVRVSTDKQAERGISLEAQAERIRAMALVQGAELSDIIVESGESAKSLNRPGMTNLLELVDAGKLKAVIVAKLDRLTRSVKDLCELLERFERKGVALVSVAESLDTGSAAGRLVLSIMAAVSQWEREAIGERTRDALHHKRSQANGWATSRLASGSQAMATMWSRIRPSKVRSRKSTSCATRARLCAESPPASTTGRCGRAAVRLGAWNRWPVSSSRHRPKRLTLKSSTPYFAHATDSAWSRLQFLPLRDSFNCNQIMHFQVL